MTSMTETKSTKKTYTITNKLKQKKMSTSKMATEQLHTQQNAEESINQTSSTQLVHNKQWGDSPLWIRGNEEGYFITIGNQRISDKYIIKEALESILPHPETVTILLNAAISTMERWMETEIKRMNEEYEKSEKK